MAVFSFQILNTQTSIKIINAIKGMALITAQDAKLGVSINSSAMGANNQDLSDFIARHFSTCRNININEINPMNITIRKSLPAFRVLPSASHR